MATHYWYIKGRILPLFAQGKRLEVRTADNRALAVKRYDDIIFNDRVQFVVMERIRRYQNFQVMLAIEDYRLIHPLAKSADEVLQLLRTIYTSEKEARGVLVFESPGTRFL